MIILYSTIRNASKISQENKVNIVSEGIAWSTVFGVDVSGGINIYYLTTRHKRPYVICPSSELAKYPRLSGITHHLFFLRIWKGVYRG